MDCNRTGRHAELVVRPRLGTAAPNRLTARAGERSAPRPRTRLRWDARTGLGSPGTSCQGVLSRELCASGGAQRARAAPISPVPAAGIDSRIRENPVWRGG